jgi:hypothetical protein
MHAVANNGSTLNWPLMDCPQIDYFSAPNDYDRKPGDCTNVRVPWASLKLHDKVFVNESDVRVHNLSASTPEETAETWGLKSINDTLEVLKRNYATLACQGLGGYWMQWEQFWYDDTQIAELFSRQSALSRFLASVERGARNQVAVVADAESQIVARYDVNPMLARQWDLCRMGAPYDFYELSDILKPGIADGYRAIIFLNTPALTKQERERIESLKGNGRTLIWMFCPGVLDRSTGWKSSADAVRELTGISVRFQDVPMRAAVRLDAAAYQQWTGRSAPSETLHPAERHYFTSPIVADDADATVIGRFDGTEPAMVARRFDQWTSILCTTTTMSPAIWRDLLRTAGVHLYVDTDDVIAGDGGPLLMIHASQGGSRKIVLPRETDVIDLFSGQLIGRGIREFELAAERGQTHFYHLGPADEALRRLGEAMRATADDQATAASLMPATHPSTQSSTVPVPLNDRGYVTSFLVAGPFDNLKEYGWSEPVEEDYLQRAGIGSEKNPDFSTWRTVSVPGPMATLPDLNLRGAMTFYLAFHLRVPSAQPIRIGIGSDDQHVLFVNGQRIGFGTPGLIVDNHVYDLDAKAGENLVLLKITNRGGPGGAVVRIMGCNGKALTGATISTDPPQAARSMHDGK